MTPPPSCGSGAPAEAPGNWGCSSGYVYTCKIGMRSGMTVAPHSSWDLSACTAGPEGRWAHSCPGSCCTSPGCSPRPSSSTSVCCSMAKRTTLLQAICIIKGAGVKAAGTDTVVQFALLHLGSSCRFWVTPACSFLPSSGPAPDTRPASHPGLHQPTASLPGICTRPNPYGRPSYRSQWFSHPDQTLTDTDLFSTTFNRATV